MVRGCEQGDDEGDANKHSHYNQHCDKNPLPGRIPVDPQHSNAKPNITAPKHAINPVEVSWFNFCKYCVYAREKKLNNSRNKAKYRTYH